MKLSQWPYTFSQPCSGFQTCGVPVWESLQCPYNEDCDGPPPASNHLMINAQPRTFVLGSLDEKEYDVASRHFSRL